MSERHFLTFTRNYQIDRTPQGRFHVAQIDPLNVFKPSAEATVGNIFEVMAFVFAEENKYMRWENAQVMLCEWTAVLEDLNKAIRAAQLA